MDNADSADYAAHLPSRTRPDRRKGDRPMNDKLVAAFAAGYRCPDCDSTTTLTNRDGVHVLTVQHDETCPVLAQHTRGGAT